MTNRYTRRTHLFELFINNLQIPTHNFTKLLINQNSSSSLTKVSDKIKEENLAPGNLKTWVHHLREMFSLRSRLSTYSKH